ncbi:hypothetical protein [Luteolibacter soli]|uniref:Uncharacterized protein n=1 Tax=Luteolibacter soli TaxID=3135280 RepID=A0ABU9B3F4_9BACT
MHRVSSVIFFLSLASTLLAGEVPEHLKATRTLDFSLPGGMGYTQHGYRVTGPENEFLILEPSSAFNPDNGGIHLRLASTSAPVSIVQADGTPFDALSIDVAEYSIYAIPSVVSFRATKADGAVLNFDFTPDGVIDGTGPKVDFQTVTFPTTWTNLARLEATTTKVALDNIKLRGLALDHFNQKEAALPQLELLGMLNGGPYDSWGVTGANADHVYLWNQRYSYDPVWSGLFSLSTRQVVLSLWTSPWNGGNLETGETAQVQDGTLVWTLGEESQVLATIGSDGVTDISYPAPAGGRVLFANHGYQGHEQFAVFLAGPEGVTPVLLPDTILPDGGTPHYYPRELHYTGSSYAIATSTSNSDSLFVISFAGGPFRLSPGNGDTIPGTGLTIDGEPQFRWLNDTSAGFIVKTFGVNTPQFEVEVRADGSWTAKPRSGPSYADRITLPGQGLVQIHEAAAVSPPGSPLVTYGPIVCHDLSPNSRYGLVVWTAEGNRHLLIREGMELDGFGTVEQVFSQACATDGAFYGIARNREGQVGLFRGHLPAVAPAVRAGAFISTTDGTVRFMAENLTHGRSYVVEKAENLTGPWTVASRFTAGSPTRSVLGAFSRGPRGFFRVVEVD